MRLHVIAMHLFSIISVRVLGETSTTNWFKTSSFTGWIMVIGSNKWPAFHVRGHLECVLSCTHEPDCVVVHYSSETQLCKHSSWDKVSIKEANSTEVTTFVHRKTLLIMVVAAKTSSFKTAQTACAPINSRLMTLSELQTYHDTGGQTVCSCGWLSGGERRYVRPKADVPCGSNVTVASTGLTTVASHVTVASTGLKDCSDQNTAVPYCILLV